MRVAVATDNGQVAEHFGRCTHYTMAKIQDSQVLDVVIIDNPGHEPGFLPRFLAEHGITCIIAGGMGQRAKQLFDAAGIDTIVGVNGSVDQVLQQYADEALASQGGFCNH